MWLRGIGHRLNRAKMVTFFKKYIFIHLTQKEPCQSSVNFFRIVNVFDTVITVSTW